MTDQLHHDVEVGFFTVGDEVFEQLPAFIIDLESHQTPDAWADRKDAQYGYGAVVHSISVEEDTYSAFCTTNVTQLKDEEPVGSIEVTYLFAFRIDPTGTMPSEKFVTEYVSASIWPRFITLARMLQGLGVTGYPRFPVRPSSISWRDDADEQSPPEDQPTSRTPSGTSP